MFTHLALVKLADPANAEHVADIIRPLGTVCEGVERWEVKLNVLPDAEFHLCMLGEFEDRAAFDRYNENPEHHAISARVRPFLDRSVPFDFEA